MLRAAARGNVCAPTSWSICWAISPNTTCPTTAPWFRWTGRGLNKAAIVADLVTTATEKYPQGITRVVLLGDPTKALGALSEQECRRVIAALELAEQRDIPLEWYALSAGARVSMESVPRTWTGWRRP